MDYIQHLRSMVGHEKVIMVVAGAMVFDSENRLLLQLRSDSESWGLPGGFMNLNESVQETARREVYEETGLTLKEMSLFGIYSGPDKDKEFANGDQVSPVQILFCCQEYEGVLRKDAESRDIAFFHLNELPENLFLEHRIMINDLLQHKEQPVIG
ncbi:NUDIX hydrolase [Pseudalkalibacillus hwajinpoensis]|uniref:NUDIX domain-containing protein n=1 Tax=Guptibacillus hwajinpoensis TaxID=208199 RepID=A0A4U1MM06_9BACL|nr:NUDIX hydrolase [Pseudalkalibacillus hwajinpoensis]TKD71602.1 NUDIX domain-containing protein [Pseudalkalibacillus hwajinpoensis]